eukprot:2333355-Amphidinium_carterae.1
MTPKEDWPGILRGDPGQQCRSGQWKMARRGIDHGSLQVAQGFGAGHGSRFDSKHWCRSGQARQPWRVEALPLCGLHVEEVELQSIFKLDPNGNEFDEWMQSFKKEHDAYLATEAYEEFQESTARDMGVTPREILPMKAITCLKPKPGMKNKVKKTRACLCGNFQEAAGNEDFASYVPVWTHTHTHDCA